MAFVAVSLGANAANPFLPLWEYIPDGEPYVFEDPDAPGKMRVYVYGSHDNLRDKYCGRDQVVWSASVEDLNKWRFDGVIFRSLNGADGKPLNKNGLGDILYAPDVANGGWSDFPKFIHSGAYVQPFYADCYDEKDPYDAKVNRSVVTHVTAGSVVGYK